MKFNRKLRYRAAKRALILFNNAIREAGKMATLGDSIAALDVMRLLSERNVTVRSLGYYPANDGRLLREDSPAGQKELARIRKLLTEKTSY